jgi:hypothetical protein
MRRAPRKTRRERAEEAAVIEELSRRPAGDTFGGDYEMAPAQPLFTPAPTGAQPMLAQGPLDSWMPVEPTLPAVIGDSIPAPEPPPEREPEVPPEYQVPQDARAMLWSGPGWAGRRMVALVREGAWEELPAIVEKGLGKNAAESATSFRHNSERIADAARRVCAEAGCPEQTGLLLRRVSEMNARLRQDTGPQRMAFRTGGGPAPRRPGSAGLPAHDAQVLERVRAGLSRQAS